MFFRMELSIKANGEETKGMDMEFSSGLMERNTKDTGKIIKLTARVHSIMLMEIYLRVSGNLIKQMVMEFTCTQMEQDMRATGKTIFRMDTELRLGLTALVTKVTILKGKNKDKEHTNGLMGQPTKVNG